MIIAGFVFVGAFGIDGSLHSNSFDRLEAGAAQPNLGYAAGCQPNPDVIAVVGDPFAISPAKSFLRLAHDLPGRLRNDDIGFIGLRFGQ